jgi:hypothetical protein
MLSKIQQQRGTDVYEGLCCYGQNCPSRARNVTYTVNLSLCIQVMLATRFSAWDALLPVTAVLV